MKIYLLAGSLLLSSALLAQPSNQHFWHTKTTTAAPEALWAIWTDVACWSTWDTGLKDATMEGPFELNATGIITSLEGQRSKFTVVEIEEGQSYTIRTKLPLGSLYVRRHYTMEEGAITYTHEVWFKGLTKGIFANSFGPKFRSMLPGVMQNIKDQLES